ncbi:MAG: DUF4139 domain-containing protein [Planctomycetota bacterium]|jgi:hypothetical protein
MRVTVPVAAALALLSARMAGCGARVLSERSVSVTIYSAPPPDDDGILGVEPGRFRESQSHDIQRATRERALRRVARQMQLFEECSEDPETVPYGIGVVRDEREVVLPRGRSEYRFADVASRIEPETVQFTCSSRRGGVRVLEQSYEYDLASADAVLDRYIGRDVTLDLYSGGLVSGKLLSRDEDAWRYVLGTATNGAELVDLDSVSHVRLPALPEGLMTRPALSWLVDSPRGGRTRVGVAYRVRGLVWEAGYSAVLAPDEKTLALSGVATIANASGAGYEDARLKLVAGEPNLLEPPELLGEATGAPGLCLVEASPEDADERFEEKSFFEYHMYTLGRPCTIKQSEVKQIALFEPALRVPVRRTFVYYGLLLPSYWYGGLAFDRDQGVKSNGKVDVYLTFENDEASGLGIPLPAGPVRVLKRDPADGQLEFAGDDEIGHTSRNEELTLSLGSAWDIAGERIQTDFQCNYDACWMRESVEIRLRNHKTEPVTVLVREHMYRWLNWEITECSVEPDCRRPPVDWPVPAWEVFLRGKAKEATVTLDFHAMPITEVVRFLVETSGVPMAVDGSLDDVDSIAHSRVTVHNERMDIASAVRAVAAAIHVDVGLNMEGDGILFTNRSGRLRPEPLSREFAPEWHRVLLEGAKEDRATLELVETPLHEAVEFVNRHYATDIVLLPDQDGGDPNPNTPIRLKVEDLPLARLVELLAKLAEARVDLKEGRVVLLPYGSPYQKVVERVYSLPGGPEHCVQLAEWLMCRVSPAKWDAAFGTSIEERNGTLVVWQTPDVHKVISALLRRIGKASDYRTVVFPVTVPADAERTIGYVVRYTW